MKIFITGGTGFVGKYLCKRLLDLDHQVIGVGTRPRFKEIQHQGFEYISADTTKPGDWQKKLGDVDAVVNLAGRSIFNVWTDYYKQQLYDSRVLTTRNLVEALPADRKVVLCSTSAVGCYGSRGDDTLTEAEPFGDDFLADLSKDWEAEALKAEEKQARVVIMRFGIVLGKNGGAFKQMHTPFRFGVGGPMGDGRQWFPWIHISDIIGAIEFCLTHEEISGTANFTAPNPLQNRDFAKALGQALKRPAFFTVPSFVIKTAMGELGEVLLSSQRAVPEKLMSLGYSFNYHHAESALEDLTR
jgi:uncharacterized protein (TIGR01777 family)